MLDLFRGRCNVFWVDENEEKSYDYVLLMGDRISHCLAVSAEN